MIRQIKARHLMQGDIMVPWNQYICIYIWIVQHLTVITPDLNCRARLFDLAVSLLPGLNAKEIDVLFVAVKAALEVSDSTLLHIGKHPIFVLHCRCVTITYRELLLELQDDEGLIQKKAYKVLSVILRVYLLSLWKFMNYIFQLCQCFVIMCLYVHIW